MWKNTPGLNTYPYAVFLSCNVTKHLNILDNMIAHFIWICFNDGTIFTYMCWKFRIVTNFFEDNLIHSIKVFNACIFIGKVDGVLVFLVD